MSCRNRHQQQQMAVRNQPRRQCPSGVKLTTVMQLLRRLTADGCETNELTWLIALQLATMPSIGKGNGRHGPPSHAEKELIKLQCV
jgi:hypothetical protein